MFKRTIAAIIILAVMLCPKLYAEAARNVGDGNGRENESVYKVDTPSVKGDNWLIYWYVCGSDIESTRIAWDRAASDFENGKIVVKDDYAPGDITRCIREVERANLSSGRVKILMQAGGTYLWGHKKFQTLNAGVKVNDENKITEVLYNGKIGRYLYDNNNKNWKPHDTFSITANPNSENDRTDMGSKESLIDFLNHGKEMEKTLYPDGKVRRVFIFVDHGGGSLKGVCKDEYTIIKDINKGHMIGIKAIHDAFDEVWRISETNPPFELVAFDTCLMSTYETAVALKGLARYMVASQEEIYGKVMFNYTSILNKLSTESTMSSEKLGQIICDTYHQDCLKADKDYDLASELVSTMSVIDLSKMPVLESSYENFSKNLLEYFEKDPDLGAFNGMALNAEHYPIPKPGVDAPEIKAVDLKDYAVQIKKSSSRLKSAILKETSDDLIKAIDGENYNGAVIYNKVRGRDRNNGGGLSTYYPFGAPNKKDIDDYKELADYNLAPKSQSELYEILFAEISENPESVVPSKLPSATNASNATNNSSDTNAVNPSPPKGSKFDLSDLSDVKITLDNETNTMKIKLTPEQMKRVASVRCFLMNFNYVDDNLIWIGLGNDTTVKADWNTGEFTSTFSGKWIMIEGHPVFVNIVSEASVDEDGNKNGSELYTVPIELNNRQCNLLISCKYPEVDFRLVGARPETNSDVPTGEIYGIKKGDTVNPQYYIVSWSLEKMYDVINQSEFLKELTQKYPEFEKIYYSDMSYDEKQEASKKWIETLPEDEKEELTKNAFAFADKLADEFISGRVLKFETYPGAPFEIKDTMKINLLPLSNGYYFYAFEFVNPVGGKNVYSDRAVFRMKDEKILDSLDSEKTSDFIKFLVNTYFDARQKVEAGKKPEE